MVIDPSCRKTLCVADACSLLFSAQIELKGKNILEWLLDRNHIYIHPEVKYECFDKIQKGRVDLSDPQQFKRHISKNEFRNIDISDCLTYLEKYCDENGFSDFSKLGLGEKNSAALSLYLSINQKKPTILLTDDYEAEKTITPILQEQKFAIIKAVPDFIIYLFQTNYDLTENQIIGVLQSYYSIRRKPVVVRHLFDKRMKFNCRSYWIKECGLKCC